MDHPQSNTPRRWTLDRPESRRQPLPRDGDRRWGQRFVLYGLAATLVTIGLWCFVILGRTESLRKDLARHMDWLAEAGASETE